VLVYLGKNIRTPKTCAIGKDNDLVTKEKSLLFGNKKSVRPVIVSMKGGSQMTITSPTPARPASEKQVAFLKTLISERANDLVVDFATLTSKQASDLIGSLISALSTRFKQVERQATFTQKSLMLLNASSSTSRALCVV